jgi:hypothetical protein
MRMTVETEQLLQDGGAHECVYHNRTAWRCAVPTATTRILGRRFAGTCETVGQVFKCVWRLR